MIRREQIELVNHFDRVAWEAAIYSELTLRKSSRNRQSPTVVLEGQSNPKKGVVTALDVRCADPGENTGDSPLRILVKRFTDGWRSQPTHDYFLPALAVLPLTVFFAVPLDFIFTTVLAVEDFLAPKAEAQFFEYLSVAPDRKIVILLILNGCESNALPDTGGYLNVLVAIQRD